MLVPWLDLVPWLELQRHAVHAIAQAGWLRAVIEDVTKVAAAPGAHNFVAFHSVAAVASGDDVRGNERFPKTGPARAGFELRVAGKERQIARRTVKYAGTMLLQQRARTGALSSFPRRVSRVW
jgi:hypothetical protein